MSTSKTILELRYEVEKLKAKLNFSADAIKDVDKELLFLKISKDADTDVVNDKIHEVRDSLRDLSDFMRESCE